MAQLEEGRAPNFVNELREEGFARIWRIFAGISFSLGASFLGIQIAACVVALVLSKHEDPPVPLRAFIIGVLSACCLSFLFLLFDYLVQRRLISDDLDTDDNAFTLLAGQAFQAAAVCIQQIVACFVLAWYITGCVWLSKAGATSSDAPILFWTSMGFVILAASGFAIFFLVLCCCVPCCFCIAACLD